MNSIKKFFKSDLASGTLLIISTIMALFIANSPLKEQYHHFISDIYILGNLNIHMLINDFLMAIFFLIVGIEIRNELLYGHLSSIKKASFPIISPFGGVIVPALIFIAVNINTEFLQGVGIPISTDIAFALALFMVFKNKLNPSLKVFLLSLAVVDDLISIFVIGFLYSSTINYTFLLLSAFILITVLLINKVLKVEKIYPYIILGLFLWFFVYKSGVHATISGVLLAFVIPIKNNNLNKNSVAQKLEHILSPICNLLILPLFALANTAINLNVNTGSSQFNTLINGIILGLVVGKPLGIMLFSYIATKLNITEKPKGISWISILKVSMLSGIGFTMSIFVSELAFSYSHDLINISKIAILIASIITVSCSYFAIIILPKIKEKCTLCSNFKKIFSN